MQPNNGSLDNFNSVSFGVLIPKASLARSLGSSRAGIALQTALNATLLNGTCGGFVYSRYDISIPCRGGKRADKMGKISCQLWCTLIRAALH